MATIHHVETPSGWTHQAAPQDDRESSFGEWLTQARTARGLTLDDISRETKIPRRNLEALEHGNLGVIPAFYQRAEVRAIARAVGVDERLAIGRLDTAITPAVESQEERKEDVARPSLRPGGALAFLALAFGVLLAAAGIGRAILSSTAPRQHPGNSMAAAGATAATPSGADVVAVSLGRQGATEPPVALETAAPAAAAATASFTEIVVTTDPPGAGVTVNGISWGVSPVTIRHLAPGPKRIRATKDGFVAAEQELALGDGQRQALNLRLPGAE